MSLPKLDKTNFHETIANSAVPVIVDFYADWCGPCKMIAPVLEEMAAEADGAFAVYKIDSDAEPDLAAEFQVRRIPNIVSFKDGKLHKRLEGAYPKEQLLKLIE